MNEKESFEAFLKMLDEKLKKNRVQVINPLRVAEVKDSFDILSRIALSVDPNAKLKWGTDELNDGSLSIDIEANEIIVHKKELTNFIKGIEKASNFEIYSIRGGKVRMSLMFYGCFKEL